MAQFDVHANTARTGLTSHTLLSSSRGASRRRVPDWWPPSVQHLVALWPIQHSGRGSAFEGKAVILDPLQIVPIRRSSLGRHVASLADDVSSGAIITAIDAVITRAYG